MLDSDQVFKFSEILLARKSVQLWLMPKIKQVAAFFKSDLSTPFTYIHTLLVLWCIEIYLFEKHTLAHISAQWPSIDTNKPHVTLLEPKGPNHLPNKQIDQAMLNPDNDFTLPTPRKTTLPFQRSLWCCLSVVSHFQQGSHLANKNPSTFVQGQFYAIVVFPSVSLLGKKQNHLQKCLLGGICYVVTRRVLAPASAS